MRFLITVILLCCLIFQAYAQPQQKPSLIYKNDVDFGIIAHTHGFGLITQFSHQRKSNTYRLTEFAFHTLKHPKEFKFSNENLKNARPFVYGKINALYAIKANYGNIWVLADKEAEESIRIDFAFSAGPIFGLVKPVYYDIYVPNPDNEQDVKSEKFNPDDPVQQENILGQSKFYKGINETRLYVGVNLKPAFRFQWGPEDDRYYCLETGVFLDAFPQNVPIFAYIQNEQVFINLFLSLTYGFRK